MRLSFAGLSLLAAMAFGSGIAPCLASGGTAGGAAPAATVLSQHPGSGGIELPLPGGGTDAEPEEDAAPPDDPAKEDSVTKTAPPPPVMHDLSRLPEPARRMRVLIENAAKTGEIQALRPLLGKGATQTQLAISGQQGDPIAYLRSISGDPEGQEVLAILLDVLDAGFVDMDPGKPDETYVWPYFFSRPIDSLTAPQRVELLRIVTAGDFADMKANGGYNFFRVGITPDGQWKFFVAGD